MKNTRLLIAMWLLLSSMCNAQQLNWLDKIPFANVSRVAEDSQKNIYVTGSFTTTVDFNPGPGTYTLAPNGESGYVTKLDAFGNFKWAKNVGGIAICHCVTKNGTVYVAGWFNGTFDFNPDSAITQNITSVGAYDMFVTKLDSSGNLIWVKTLGTSVGADNGIYDIALDSDENIYLVGSFQDVLDFDPGTGVHSIMGQGNYDMFIEKLDSSGNFIFAKTIGAANYMNKDNFHIAVTDSNGIYVTGWFSGPLDFDPGAGVVTMTCATNNSFLLNLTLSGDFIWSKRIGNPLLENKTYDLTKDNYGHLYTTGIFSDSADFDPGVNEQILRSAGKGLFIQKFNMNGTLVWAKGISSTSIYTSPTPRAISVDEDGSVYLAGNYTKPTDVDPGPGIYSLSGNDSSVNTYLLKLNSSGAFVSANSINNNILGLNIRVADISANYTSEILLVGAFSGCADFDPDTSQYNSCYNGVGFDLFLAKWNADICSQVSLNIDTVSNITCSMQTGYASGAMANGHLPYSYSWNVTPAITSPQAVFVNPGIFTLTAVDDSGCTRSSSVLIEGPVSTDTADFTTNLIAGTFRPGVPVDITIDVANLSCYTSQAQVALVLDSLVNFVTSSPSPDLISGDTLYWNADNLLYNGPHFTPIVHLTTSINAIFSNSVSLITFVYPSSADKDSSNNYRPYLFQVVNSYDPNNILVYPTGECDDKYVHKKQKLTYTINFQNTGNAPAIDVFLLDTLSKCLNISTLRIVAQSHTPLITEVLSDATLKFRFNNIMLADSVTNESDSKGYVVFEITAFDTTADYTLLQNKAGIYFDYNEPVITNTVSNTLVEELPVLVTNLNIQACSNYQFGQVIYTQSGTYAHSFTTAEGCDSTVILHLTINTPDTSQLILNNANTLTAPNGSQYQWYLNGGIISNANSKVYTATISGLYNVSFVDTNGCDVTLDQIAVVVNNITSPANDIKISFITETNQIHISTGGLLTEIIIYDISGKEIVKSSHNINTIDFSSFPAGGYFVEARTTNFIARKKIIKL